MIARALPPEEWPRLAGTELDAVWPLLTPETTRILAIEEDGAIIGCWALLPVWHVEGCWIAPAARRRGRVGHLLLTTMARWIANADLRGVMTAAPNETIAHYLTRLGARPLPGQHFVWPRKESDRCLPA
ncbi:MAG TPA: GNAT family N-acetyltransferase [Burkholderiales bacterium]|nr:GNAT family N-acetyltransferase [Burkholderiales bacterium]